MSCGDGRHVPGAAIEDGAAWVIATPGAGPVVPGGYGAALRHGVGVQSAKQSSRPVRVQIDPLHIG